jgi:hypothetical protein
MKLKKKSELHKSGNYFRHYVFKKFNDKQCQSKVRNYMSIDSFKIFFFYTSTDIAIKVQTSS